MNEPVTVFACACSAQAEGEGEAPKCWSCGLQMYAWKQRNPKMFSSVLEGDAADRRNASGGYS